MSAIFSASMSAKAAAKVRSRLRRVAFFVASLARARPERRARGLLWI